MTPEAAIYRLLSELEIPVYAVTSVPSDAEFPYSTVDMVAGAFWDGEMSLTLDLWYRGDSESAPNAKAHELSSLIGSGGRILKCDGGAIWVKRGSPFSQSMGDQDDDKIKRRHINLIIESFLQD